MKKFNLLIENFTLFLEATGKPYYGLWQDIYLKKLGYKDYNSMTTEQKQIFEKGFEEYKKEHQKFIDSKLDQFETTSQVWITNVFKAKEQKYPEDMDKLIKMVQQFNILKKKTGILTKEQNDLQKHSFSSLADLLDEYESSKTNYGKNKIIKDEEDWKIVKLVDYDDAMVTIDNNHNSWCITEESNFNETYDKPFYVFFKDDKPYACLNLQSHKSEYDYSPIMKPPYYNIKDVRDHTFRKLDTDFEKMFSWLIFEYLPKKNLNSVGDDIVPFLEHDYEKYKVLFKTKQIIEYAKYKHSYKLYYKLSNLSEYDKKDHIQNLHLAIAKDDIEYVNEHLKKSKDFYSTDKHFEDVPAWFKAISIGNLDIIKKFIEHGVDVNSKDNNGNSALLIASKKDNHKIVYELLKQPNIDVNIKTTQGGETALIIATENGSDKIVYELLKQPNIDVNIKTSIGNMALITASKKGYDKIVTELLKHKDIDKQSCKDALIVASDYGQDKVVVELLKHPNINININGRDSSGYTSLMTASLFGHEKVVAELLKHPNININVQSQQGSTPLMIASMRGNDKVVAELLKHPKIDVNIKNNDSQTALFFRCSEEHKKVIEELLKHPNININIKGPFGETPLLNATRNHNIEIVKLLKSHGATE